MADKISIAKWRQRGRSCLWRYEPARRNLEGWHFTADREGCDSLCELISILLTTNHPCHRTLDLSDPAEVGTDRVAGRLGQKAIAAARLRLAFEPNGSPGHAEFEECDDRVIMTLGSGSLASLRPAIEDVRRGTGDFSISLGDHGNCEGETLWFWWWPKRR